MDATRRLPMSHSKTASTSARGGALYLLGLFAAMALVLLPFFLLESHFGGRWYYDELNPSSYQWFETLAYPVLFLAPPAVAIWFGRRIGSPWQAFAATLLPFAVAALYLWATGSEPAISPWSFYPEPAAIGFVGGSLGVLATGCALSREHSWRGIAIAACGAAIWLSIMVPAVVDYVTYWQDGRMGSIWWHGNVAF